MNIMETVKTVGSFNTLIKLINAAGLEDTLANQGPYTFFVPDDTVFEEISSEKLITLLNGPQKKVEEIILYHMLEGKFTASDLGKVKNIKTLAGYSLDIGASGGLKVDGVKIIEKDILCDNGVLHVVSGLMAP